MAHFASNRARAAFTCVLLALAFGGRTASAAVEAYTLSSAPAFASDPADYTIGLIFTTGANPIDVTHVGFLHDERWNGTHDVGIFAVGNMTALAHALVTVAGATTPADATKTQTTFDYAPLSTPLRLAANTTYRMGGTSAAFFNTVNVGQQVVSSAGVTYQGGVYAFEGATLTYPNEFAGNYALTNFQYEVVPEPASLGVLGLAGFGLLARRRGNA